MKVKLHLWAFATLVLGCQSLISQTWSALGTGIVGSSTASVFAIEHDPARNRMIFGGKFTTAGDSMARNLAAWDLTANAWLPLDEGTDNPVRSILVDSTYIYYGGDFTTIGGAPTSVGIARWDGSAYTALGSGFFRTGLHAPIASVNCLALFQDNLYAAGVFDEADGAPCMYIAKWNGGWEPVGAGINIGVFGVYDMEVYGGYLYVAGDFDGTTGVVSKNILRWDGATWSAVGSGTNNTIFTLEVMDGALYAGGMFTTAGGAPAQRIAKWDGSAWSSIGGMDADVNSLCAMGGKLYASGLFTNVAGSSCERFAIYDPATGWTPITSGLDKYAFSLATDGSSIFAGGSFNNAGGNPASRAAVFSPTVGIDDPLVSQEGVSIWPQPAQGFLSLAWEGHTTFSVEMVDLQGRVVLQQEVTSSQTLPVGGLPRGLYMALLRSSKGMQAVHAVVLQ